jgi:hypothetical protein
MNIYVNNILLLHYKYGRRNKVKNLDVSQMTVIFHCHKECHDNYF